MILLQHLDLQVVEGDFFGEGILAEPASCMPLEIADRGIEPDRVLKVEFLADLVDGVEDLVRACFVTCILYGQISAIPSPRFS